MERGIVDDPTRERKPTPKLRDDLLSQLAEKKRQTIATLRKKRVEMEKEEIERRKQEESKPKKPVYLTPDHVRRKRAADGITGELLFMFHI